MNDQYGKRLNVTEITTVHVETNIENFTKLCKVVGNHRGDDITADEFRQFAELAISSFAVVIIKEVRDNS